jgi:hypothetical protein
MSAALFKGYPAYISKGVFVVVSRRTIVDNLGELTRTNTSLFTHAALLAR